MSRKFKFYKDYYVEDENLYAKGTITMNPGLTVLVGCNGSGKSTLIHIMNEELSQNGIPVIKFDNLVDGGQNARDNALNWMNDIELLATQVTSSEGENIVINMGTFAEKVGRFVRKQKDSGKKEIWVLCDAVDSGLSIDNIIDVKKYLFDTIIQDCKKDGIDTYIIVAANEYELANGEQCFDVYNGKYIKFGDYNEYAEFIMQSRKNKEKRYQK